jgi:hypothetical protein
MEWPSATAQTRSLDMTHVAPTGSFASAGVPSGLEPTLATRARAAMLLRERAIVESPAILGCPA